MALFTYPTGIKRVFGGEASFNPVGDTIALMLLNDSYVPSASHEFVADISSFEISATNYARKTLASKTLTVVGNDVFFDCADITWSPGMTSQIAGGHALFVFKTNDSDSFLIHFDDTATGYPATFTSGQVNITINGSGLFKIPCGSP